ncbi:helix-turn-helix domain-containing protein [Leptospira weilii]|uniref:Bacteriophage CI repressor protein n=1 Tax=Leptospira weilii str. UI 13098 TaxID=1088542 RepID=M6Q5M5_9LEPT|nr:helix-turn-helix transcriptional regulator [Leptospira weilii]EMN90901.1 bacteriophage CI repressor protein [Leptospira weilii str. UI 13098]
MSRENYGITDIFMNSRIKKIYEDSGLTQIDFATKLGISHGSLNDLLTGRSKKPSHKTILAMRTEFNINPLWLLTGEGPMFASEEDVDRSNRLNAEFGLLHRLRPLPKLRKIITILEKIPESKLDQVEGILKTFMEK